MLPIATMLIHATMPGPFLAADGAGFNVWDTFSRAEPFGQLIVVLLVFFSLLAWTVMIGKYLELSSWRASNLDFERRLRDTEALLGQSISGRLREITPYARMFHDAIEAGKLHRSDTNPSVRMGLIANALQRRVGDECVRYERKMVLLGSLVSGAPFMGLLGTVVGVMVAFNGMSSSSGVGLDKIAPGVASALLATVCGLLVAIPSVFGYNFLLAQVKIMITEIENFASWLADRMELEIESQKPAHHSQPAAAPVSQQPPAQSYAQPAPSYHPALKPTPKPQIPEPTGTERYLKFDVSEEE